MIGSFLYFAYGSNMLTKRLRERCPSARPAGLAIEENHGLDFCKKGSDGSGKATLIKRAGRDRSISIHGVLYQIELSERPNLDKAESGYERHDDFVAYDTRTDAKLVTSTYIAPPSVCRDGLLPFNWYIELIIAGAREHGLGADYIARLNDVEVRQDPDRDRAERMARLLAAPDQDYCWQ